jgi:hypothetical protein
VRLYPEFATATGRIEIQRLDDLAAVAEVGSIRPLYAPRRRSGIVTSQGDASIRAALARTTFGVNGTGVKVGVISDSFRQLLGSGTTSPPVCTPIPADDPLDTATPEILTSSAPQVAGELPASIEILDDCTSVDNCGAPLDEGRALAEIVHDLAPGAEIIFHSGFNGEANMAQGIAQLASCGADVIVDDLVYEREPMFQDGPIAHAAQTAVDGGVAYFSAAGNEAGLGVDDDYLDFSPTDDPIGATGDDFHDFGGGDRFASVKVAPGCGLTVVLQWNETYPAPLGVGASSDLDLYLCTDPMNVGSCSTVSSGQGCFISTLPEGEPLEVADYWNSSGSAETVHVAVDHVCSLDPPYPQPADSHFRLAVFGNGCSLGNSEVKADCSSSSASFCFEQGIFQDFQIYGHSAAEGVVAVGASFYKEIDTNGTNDPPTNQIDVEPFSSLGGDLPFYFTGSGSPLPGAPVTRFKPDVVAPDGVNTSFFGNDLPADADTYPNFVGSSAAAPHVAAIAALIRQANPLLDPLEVKELLMTTARDIESSGPDALSGSVTTVESSQTIVVIANSTAGPADLAVSSMVLSDLVNFTLNPAAGGDACGSTTPLIVPGDSCTVGVTFDPVGAGAFSESLTINSNGPIETVSLLGTACTGQLDEVLTSGVGVSGPLTVEACNSITAGPYPIVSGSVSFRAGSRIVLRDGFSVSAGAIFSAEIDANLLSQ